MLNCGPALRCCTCGALLLLLLLLAGCRKPPFPSGAPLASETFGIGVHLGLLADDAKSLSGPASATAQVEFITAESLLSRKPYSERPEGKDLVLCVYSDELPQPGDKAPLPAGTITEIRCYLAPEGQSKLTLLGQNMAGLNPDEVVAMLGKPFTPYAPSPDGRWHLTFYFSVAGRPDRAYLLTTSHEVDGHCFAVELAETAAPH